MSLSLRALVEYIDEYLAAAHEGERVPFALVLHDPSHATKYASNLPREDGMALLRSVVMGYDEGRVEDIPDIHRPLS
jgi:hypothetical protein